MEIKREFCKCKRRTFGRTIIDLLLLIYYCNYFLQLSVGFESAIETNGPSTKMRRLEDDIFIHFRKNYMKIRYEGPRHESVVCVVWRTCIIHCYSREEMKLSHVTTFTKVV